MVVVFICLHCHLILGEDEPILTMFFSKGCNHHLVIDIGHLSETSSRPNGRFCRKARATTAVPRPVPEMQENPIDDWDTMLGRSQAWVPLARMGLGLVMDH